MSVLTDFYHWINTSPNLMQGSALFRDLRALNCAPLENNHRYLGNPRLGFLYQYLCTQAFELSPYNQVVIEEVQLNENGKTLGAIDLIVNNTQHNQLEHWEVAIKFYLLHQGTWFGPNAHDQLDKKLDRMLNHQLLMSKSDAFGQQHPQLEVDEHCLLMQGRLYINPFHHEVVPSHCLGYKLNPTQMTGHWCYYSQAKQIDLPLFDLPKDRWAIGRGETANRIEPDPTRFIHAQTANGQFWFVVPDRWPKT